MTMKISEASEHLATLLRAHLLAVTPQDPAVRFLEAVGSIVQFRDEGDLNAWETAVLALFCDSEWQQFERRKDFGLLENVWEVGRLNMYGAINASEARKFYQQASKGVKDITGSTPVTADEIDFSQW